MLNTLGYGQPGRLTIDLVYNPNGAFLPPPQESLEVDYKRELSAAHGIMFNQLLTITNMPISRFGSVLASKGNFQNYLTLLKDNFSQQNLNNVMCKTLISVDWQGFVYDCDFNQMLEMPLKVSVQDAIVTDRQKLHLRDILQADLAGEAIQVAEHCYGCTAGQGSSCGGALD